MRIEILIVASLALNACTVADLQKSGAQTPSPETELPGVVEVGNPPECPFKDVKIDPRILIRQDTGEQVVALLISTEEAFAALSPVDNVSMGYDEKFNCTVDGEGPYSCGGWYIAHFESNERAEEVRSLCTQTL